MGRALRVVAAAVLGLVALGVVAAGWLRSPGPISAEDAAEVAGEALTRAGVDADVGPEPSPGTYQPEARDSVAVWQTVATVDGGTLVLWLAQDDGEPVFLDDRGPSGATQLLTDAQFQSLAAHEPTLARDRQLRENLALTTAAACVLLLAVALASTARR